jgi:glycerol uptake facilitator-like aquaporin
MRQYIVEYMGTLVVLVAKLISDGDPIVMGIVFFATFSITKGISTGYFTPFVPVTGYLLGRMTLEESGYNMLAQVLAGISAVILFKPIKIFMNEV